MFTASKEVEHRLTACRSPPRRGIVRRCSSRRRVAPRLRTGFGNAFGRRDERPAQRPKEERRAAQQARRDDSAGRRMAYAFDAAPTVARQTHASASRAASVTDLPRIAAGRPRRRRPRRKADSTRLPSRSRSQRGPHFARCCRCLCALPWVVSERAGAHSIRSCPRLNKREHQNRSPRPRPTGTRRRGL